MKFLASLGMKLISAYYIFETNIFLKKTYKFSFEKVISIDSLEVLSLNL